MENEQKYLTKTELAEFTEETLLPAMEKMMDEKLDEKLDPIMQRLNSIEEEIADIKITLERIDKRTDEDIKATYFEIEKLKNRIGELEQQVKLLKTEKA